MTKTKRSPFLPENNKFEVNKTLIFDSHLPTQVMDFNTISATATATATINTPDTDTELIPTSDPKSGAFRSFSFNNGTVLPLKPHHHPFPPPPPQTAVSYKECLKNHAASLGGHALDGCGEFYPSPIANPSDPSSLKCAACGCHRNFHRRDAPDEPRAFTPPKGLLLSSTHHHHHRLLPPPPAQHSSSPSPSRSTSPGPSTTLSPHSPPPVSHVPPSFFGTPTQMLLALSSAAAPSDGNNNPTGGKSGRKRSRTKFSQEQKEKMLSFADKLGWRMQRSEDKFVEDFCDQIGIGRNVFKVWMHNNKHQRKQRLLSSAGLINVDGNGGNSSESNAEEDNNTNKNNNNNNNVNVNVDIVNSPNESSRDRHHHHQRFYLSNNGSSSSS